MPIHGIAEHRGQIFISYATRQRAVAEEIGDALSQAGLKPWIAHREVAPGESFVERINSALQEASYLVLLLSEDALESGWVTREWTSVLEQDGTTLIPVLVEKVELPALLRTTQHVDLTRSREAGIRRLVEFFNREDSRPKTSAGTSRAPKSDEALRGASRREIRLVALRCVTEADLQAFLFEAEIETGVLVGNSLNERLLSLLHRVASDGQLEHFGDWLSRERYRCVVHQLSELRR